ncbi:family 43 glycosylhydrolase [Micromonospora sp. BQ11]|uniref:family 43 glycosylhydrolase n=1 Tax=Micromonospora sp. BQ11 TaxID=3452212 RepID=UPI003F8AA237
MATKNMDRRRAWLGGTALLTTAILVLTGGVPVSASDPIITDQYTADPSARLFGDKLYLYPSHDRDDSTWWDMEDWHVFSSSTLDRWTDHGVIASIDGVDKPWAKSKAWAPDAATRNGKYYFYFPVKSDEGRGNTDHVGVAVAESPTGPFTPLAAPLISGYPQAFDPTVFTDSDGTSYAISGQSADGAPNPFIAKLNADMTTLAETPRQVQFNGSSNFFEGAWMHKYNNRYYLSYARSGTEIGYATADNIYGPYENRGVILSDLPYAANTTHGSILAINGQWYIFYHNRQRSVQNGETSDYKRSVVVDKLYHNADGTIEKVIPTSGPVQPVSIQPPMSVNDNTTGTGNGQFEYSPGWSQAGNSGAHSGDNHYTNSQNASYRVRFDGVQIKVNSPTSPVNGSVAFSVTNSNGDLVVPKTTVSLKANVDSASDVVFDSHQLPAGQYTLHAHAVGDGYINADRVQIYRATHAGPPQVPASNLVANSDFEASTVSPWTVEGDSSRAGQERAYPQSGNGNGYLHPTSTQSVALVQEFIAPVTRQYTLTAQAAGNFSAVLGVDVQGVAQHPQPAVSANGVYAGYTLTFTARAQERVKVWYYGGATNVQSAWAVLDHVSVR